MANINRERQTTLSGPVKVRTMLAGVGGQFTDTEVARVSVITIKSAAILTLHSVPLDLSTLDPNLGAPGAGKAILLDFISANLVYGTATYASGGALSITYGSSGGALHATAIPAALVTATANEVFATNGGFSAQLASSTLVNTGLFLSAASGDFTTGDGVINLTLYYSIQAMQ